MEDKKLKFFYQGGKFLRYVILSFIIFFLFLIYPLRKYLE